MFKGDLTTPQGRRAAWRDSILVDHAFFRLGWTNLATVVPGRMYRSNHPTPRNLARMVKRLGIRSVLNLRGNRQCGSQALSQAMSAELDVAHHFFALRSRDAPEREDVLRLIDLFATLTEPALMHCKSGADRTGLAAGIFLLANGASAAAALEQLSWRFLHVSASRTGILDEFFRRFAAEAEGRTPFRQWVERDYDAEALRRDFRAGRFSTFVVDRILRRE